MTLEIASKRRSRGRGAFSAPSLLILALLILTLFVPEVCRMFADTNVNLHPNHDFEIAIGSSGTIVAAASIISFRRSGKFKKTMNGFTFTANEIFQLTSDVLKCESPVDRLFIEGMEITRADIIPAGLLILSEVFKTFELKEMMVSETALREGIIIDTILKMDEFKSLLV